MASALLNNPTYQLQPSAEQVALQTNYITNFNFLNQYLPDTYEKEFERYGNRTIASFLRMVGAEMPSNSDQIKWAECQTDTISPTGGTLAIDSSLDDSRYVGVRSVANPDGTAAPTYSRYAAILCFSICFLQQF